MADVRAANRINGMYFFSPDTMRFFKSKIVSSLLGGKYFITRETDPHGKTRFTIREVMPDAHIKTVGDFHSYLFREDAKEEIKSLLKAVSHA